MSFKLITNEVIQQQQKLQFEKFKSESSKKQQSYKNNKDCFNNLSENQNNQQKNMHYPVGQRQQFSNMKYQSSARDQSKIGSSRQFYGAQSQFSNKKPIDKLGEILQILHSQNEFKIRTFKQSFSMMSDIETIQFEDGSRYDGQVIDQGIRHGIGIFQTADGDIYLGDWQEDRFHGYGLYVYQDGQRYEGQLYQGMKEGQGKYFYKDGRVYEGRWSNDQRQGQGIETDQIKGVYYQGQWSNDQKQGHGRICILNNSIISRQQTTVLFDGIWSRDIFTEGVINSEVYQGEFRNQTLTGKGVYKFTDGSVYNGQFYNNLFHGQGIYYYANGDIYEGGFVCGLKSGSGVYKYFTGDVYDGEYQKDLKSGEGKFIFVNGNFYVGQFQKDSFHGNGKYFFNQTQFITGTWHYGKLIQNNMAKQTLRQNNFTAKTLQNSSTKKTPNKTLRSPSPLRVPSLIPQSSVIRRCLSPYSHEKINSNNQKAGVLHAYSSRSPIKNNQMGNTRIPSDRYFNKSPNIPSSAQNFSNLSGSKQMISHTQQSHNNQRISNFRRPQQKPNLRNIQQHQETQNQLHFNKLIKKQNQTKMISQSQNIQNGKLKQYHTEKRTQSKNLFHLMNEDLQQQQPKNIPPLPLSQPKIQKVEQGPKKSKRKLQYR